MNWKTKLTLAYLNREAGWVSTLKAANNSLFRIRGNWNAAASGPKGKYNKFKTIVISYPNRSYITL